MSNFNLFFFPRTNLLNKFVEKKAKSQINYDSIFSVRFPGRGFKTRRRSVHANDNQLRVNTVPGFFSLAVVSGRRGSAQT